MLPKDVVGLCLGGIVWVGVGEQLLNAQQHLPDAERGAPVLMLVQNRQTDGARGKDVRVEERRHEAASRRHRRVLRREEHLQLVEAACPDGLSGGGKIR